MGCKTIFCPGDVGTHCAGRAGAEALFTGIRRSRGPKRFSNPGVAPEGFFADTAEVVTEILRIKPKLAGRKHGFKSSSP